ncbi:MAG: hypothetical protein U1F83_07980 [Verrucomicrobiota bacterium]
MQTQTLNRITAAADNADRSQQLTPFIKLTDARAHRRPVRVALPVRRRESCLTKRALLAAMRKAEFAEWMNNGGDFLDSMHQPGG